MVRQGLLLGISAIAILLAGCSGGSGDDGAPNEEGPTAPPASFTAETGGIEGLVTDDEQLPVVGAPVGILALSLETGTDAEGKFSFSNVEPGVHDVVVQAAGYEVLVRKVTVTAGEVASENFQLTPVPIEEPFHFTQQGEGFFGCGASWRPAPPVVPIVGINICYTAAAVTGNPEIDDFVLTWDLGQPTERWTAAVFEQEWQSTQAAGNGLTMLFELCANCFPRLADVEGTSPLRAVADREGIEASIDEVDSSDCDEDNCVFISRVFSTPQLLGPSSPADVGVTFQQHFSQYATYFFDEQPDELFSAIPQ